MMKLVLTATIADLVLASGVATAAPNSKASPKAGANPNAGGANAGANGCGASAPGQNKDALIAYYQYVEPTGSPTPGGMVDSLGGAISGGFYGNTSNSGIDVDAPDSGHGVTPSISPGPQTLTSGGPGTGTSVGEAVQAGCGH